MCGARLLMAVLVLAAGPAAAEAPEPAGQTHLRFEASWAGLRAADFVISLGNGDDGTENTFRLRTRGLFDPFIRLRVAATSQGRAADQSRLYRVDYTNRRRQRSVKVRFDGEQAVPTIHTLGATPAEDREKEAKVPPAQRTNVLDPLTALAGIFGNARHLLTGGPQTFVLQVYDGRRRFDLKGQVMGTVWRVIKSRSQRVHRLRFTADPIAGFKTRHRDLWRKYAFDVYLSTDGRFLPLLISPAGPGPEITLVEVCPRPCALPPG